MALNFPIHLSIIVERRFMDFEILSHAGLAVNAQGKTLLVDPWIVGSCYWRSWWNYPPVKPGTAERFKPDAIYLTHIHWDHFQSVSLRKYAKETPIVVPRGPTDRMERDLRNLGFHNIHAIPHGGSYEIASEFRLFSYHFDGLLDSGVVIEAEGRTLFDANDAKFMGRPLKQILRNHAPLDFVLRSHSSANDRVCYDLIDAPSKTIDSGRRYVREFAQFVQACDATYAIPFASNQCCLHRDTFKYNDYIVTPQLVREYFDKHDITTPALNVMVSGDSWSEETGFSVAEQTYFTERDRHIQDYLEAQHDTLAAFYAREEKTRLKQKELDRYIARFSAAVPWLIRRWFKGKPVTFVLSSGEHQEVFRMDLWEKTFSKQDQVSDENDPAQIHTSAFVFRRCMAVNLFSHLGISKRVRYRCTSASKSSIDILKACFQAYEYDYFPLKNLLSWRVVHSASLRWREVFLYAAIFKDILLTDGPFNIAGFDMGRYLPKVRQASSARRSSPAS